MTPQQFHDAYLATAQEVSAGTGIDPVVLLAQWANETDWGNVVVGCNLGNIRCSPTSFCHYATLSDFAAACIATYHNGYYSAVLAATSAAAQLAAIVASPWDAGHYGGSLAAFYTPLEALDMTPLQDKLLNQIFDLLMYGETDTNNPAATAGFDKATVLPAITGIPRATANLQPVLDAIAALSTAVTAITAKVVAIEAKIDADLH